ncbi:hypothetical protein FG386_002680 [Cryptosporidium ryanae]|uniref:uncharacterized protein n=1 Tax=Cryptosporidium ryanae TaxID=515981 RepID=UPI00351A541F|nr:hypothetical protein FG386_002680 [Cryptosporidium ryanae]
MDELRVKLDRHNEIAKERYVHALNLERARHLDSISEKAEKLRRLYKTRLEEDLRSFIIVHGEQKNKSTRFPIESKNRGINHIVKLSEKSKLLQNNESSKMQINTSYMPTLAWPASLRSKGKFNICSLFYTLETCVPLSTSQIGGGITTKADKKNDEIDLKKLALNSSYKGTNNQKSTNTITKVQANSMLHSNSSLVNVKRQKLFAKYGPPFTWIKGQTKTTLCHKSPSTSSEVSTPKSQFFTEIPEQPSIYPLELQIENNTNNGNDISEFIRKTLRMQKMLEVLIGDE